MTVTTRGLTLTTRIVNGDTGEMTEAVQPLAGAYVLNYVHARNAMKAELHEQIQFLIMMYNAL